jgi:iron complex outermembrane receptor protein
VTINGIPLNDAESQIVYWVNLPDLAASASEIQVQRGVGASTNGAGAFGATINLDLSKIENERFASLTNTLGSFGTRKHALSLGTGLIGGKVASRHGFRAFIRMVMWIGQAQI